MQEGGGVTHLTFLEEVNGGGFYPPALAFHSNPALTRVVGYKVCLEWGGYKAFALLYVYSLHFSINWTMLQIERRTNSLDGCKVFSDM